MKSLGGSFAAGAVTQAASKTKTAAAHADATTCIDSRSEENGVADGTRTHDSRDHNPGLYQLSYGHH